MLRVAVVMGTRPEAIKLAPVVQRLVEDERFHPIVVATAQHRHILDQVLSSFGIRPTHDLDLLTAGQTLADLTARAVTGLSEVMARDRPDVVLVQGDTTTSFLGALAAYYNRVGCAHVEAGLRSGDRFSPYPEEVNRRLISQIADLHLAPTPSARANLLAEGVLPSSVVVTGNTVIDALQQVLALPVPLSLAPLLNTIGDRQLLLVTAHRRESWGEPMQAIGRALRDIARRNPELFVVFPIHPNPLVRAAIEPAIGTLPNVALLEPLEYAEFTHLMGRSTLLLTDSGGIQEEGPSIGKPVLVMRETTERPEAIAAGTARLVGRDPGVIAAAVQELLDVPAVYQRMAAAVNPYGDGKAAQRTVAALARFLGLDDPVEEFSPAEGR